MNLNIWCERADISSLDVVWRWIEVTHSCVEFVVAWYIHISRKSSYTHAYDLRFTYSYVYSSNRLNGDIITVLVNTALGYWEYSRNSLFYTHLRWGVLSEEDLVAGFVCVANNMCHTLSSCVLHHVHMLILTWWLHTAKYYFFLLFVPLSCPVKV